MSTPPVTLFDAYFFVDWSASSSPSPREPKPDAVWMGGLVRGFPPGFERYYRTRSACVDDLAGRLRALTAGGCRVLVGFDFPYGYPRGLAAALELPLGTGPAWRVTWAHLEERVVDTAENRNNRWAVASGMNEALTSPGGAIGPFWGCPASASLLDLTPDKQGGRLTYPFATRSGRALRELRHAERLAGGSVQPTWKLYTTGSVGSQALLGIPRVARLRADPELAAFSRVWPFETGFARPDSAGPSVVHAEIWPSLLNRDVAALVASDPTLIRDRAQVRAMCRWAEREDAEGRLGALFGRPAGLTDVEVRDCVEEEGWILGLGAAR